MIYKAWHSNGVTGYVRANHYTAMDYVRAYVKYKDAGGWWTSYYYIGSDTTPTTSGDYYLSWSIRPGYVQMRVYVKAYDSANHYLGSDTYYVSLPTGGGDPPPPPID
ncbi:MAG: hypothetical protein P1Q69_17885 [Candidatus Thorarchaeota archaeon]|nr:hypothetical protein [Candidatus Thorarchaeota archaeon]